MVEINNQRGRSSICWRGRRELITDDQKTRNHGYVIVGLKLFAIADAYQKHTLNPKLKSTGAGRYQLLSRWWDAHHRKQQHERLLSEKSGRCGDRRLRAWRFTYD